MLEVVQCYDGHFQRAIYGIGPFIADYQEQVLVATVVQGWCAKYIYISARCSELLIYYGRCTADPDNIDEGGHTRTFKHSTYVTDTFGFDVAWVQYGIAAKCIVSVTARCV